MYLSKVKKSGIWFVYYRKPNGNKTRKSTKSKLKREALKFLNDFEKTINEKPNKKQISLRDWKHNYLESIKATHAKKTYYLSERALNNFIEYVKEDVLLIGIDKQFAQK